jgi:hypothetical protein
LEEEDNDADEDMVTKTANGTNIFGLNSPFVHCDKKGENGLMVWFKLVKQYFI